MDLSSLASSLQTSTKLTRAEKDLMEKFRAAALSISLLYKSSLSTSKRAYSAGYSTCLADVLQMIQHGLSASHSADDGISGSEMTIGRIMDWVEARQETIRLEEEDQDGVNEDDVGEGGAGSAYNSSTKSRETFGDRMGSQGPGMMSKAGSHSNVAPSGSSGSTSNRFAQSIASSSMKRTGSAPISMRPVPLTNPSEGPSNLPSGSLSARPVGDQPLASSSAFCDPAGLVQSEQDSNFQTAPRLTPGETDRPVSSTNNSTHRASFSVPPPTRPSSVRPSEETFSVPSLKPSFQASQDQVLPQSSSSFTHSSSPSASPTFPSEQRQTSFITADAASAPSSSLNPMTHSSPLVSQPMPLSPSLKTTAAANRPSASLLPTISTTPTPGSTSTDVQAGSFPSPKAASPILFPPSNPKFTFGLPSNPFPETLSSRAGNPSAEVMGMGDSASNGIFSGVSIPHQAGAGVAGTGGSAGEREPTGSKRRYAAMMAAAGSGPMMVGTSGASAGAGGMDDVGDITTTISTPGSVGAGGGGRRKGSRRTVKTVGVGKDVGSMEGVEESEEREKKRSARRRD